MTLTDWAKDKTLRITRCESGSGWRGFGFALIHNIRLVKRHTVRLAKRRLLELDFLFWRPDSNELEVACSVSL